MSWEIALVVGIIIGGVATPLISGRIQRLLFKRKGKISWLDYLKIRDLMAAGHNYEAAIFTLKKAYNITDEEAETIEPERFHELMSNLKTKEAKGGL